MVSEITFAGPRCGIAAEGRRRSLATASLVVVDVAGIAFAAVTGWLLASAVRVGLGLVGDGIGPSLSERMPVHLALAACVVLWFNMAGHYRPRRTFLHEAREVFLAAGICLVVEGFVHFAQKEDASRLLALTTWLVVPFLILPARIAAKRLLRERLGFVQRAVIVGSQTDIDIVRRAFQADSYPGYAEVGALSENDGHALRDLVRRSEPDVVVIAPSEDVRPDEGIVSVLSALGLPFVIAQSMGSVRNSDMLIEPIIGSDVVILGERGSMTTWAAGVGKRLFDVIVAAAILSLLAVPLTIMAALVAVDGANPIYRHRRTGLAGRQFHCLKLRSMVADADGILARHLETDAAARVEWAQNQKLVDDPRITPLGRFLRRTAIDELPQLVNVLKGDMSLVGPRPVTGEELMRYGKAADAYLSVRPGITGIWQVSGRSDLSYPRRVELDAWYVRNWSLWSDLAILVLTVPALLSRRGAY